MGSPTALANSDVDNKLRQKASSGTHGLYIPSGALWGGNDIKKMADRGTLKVNSYNLGERYFLHLLTAVLLFIDVLSINP